MVFVLKIGGYPARRASMEDDIALSQFAEFSGLKDRHTIIAGLLRLQKLGLVRKVGKPTVRGQRWRLIRHIDFAGQVELFGEHESSGVETTPEGCEKPHRGGGETTPTKPLSNNFGNNVITQQRAKRTAPKQRHSKARTPEPKTDVEIVAHLRSLQDNGNGYARAAELSLVALKLFWDWGFKHELVRSWKFVFRAASRAESAFERALGDTKSFHASGSCVNPPAYFTRIVRNYAKEDGVDL